MIPGLQAPFMPGIAPTWKCYWLLRRIDTMLTLASSHPETVVFGQCEVRSKMRQRLSRGTVPSDIGGRPRNSGVHPDLRAYGRTSPQLPVNWGLGSGGGGDQAKRCRARVRKFAARTEAST